MIWIRANCVARWCAERRAGTLGGQMITLHPVTPAITATFKEVRLRALQDTPLAFGSTYAKESRLSDSDWEMRVAHWNGPGAIALLAMDGTERCGIVAGFVDKEDQATAHLVSMWVAPTHRRHGVGRRWRFMSGWGSRAPAGPSPIQTLRNCASLNSDGRSARRASFLRSRARWRGWGSAGSFP